MNKFTPGPWTVEAIEGYGFKIKEWNGSAKEDAANAALIAAAPELLEACKIYDNFKRGLASQDTIEEDVLKIVRNAIAKAEGA